MGWWLGLPSVSLSVKPSARQLWATRSGYLELRLAHQLEKPSVLPLDLRWG